MEKAIHDGHRERMKERFRTEGLDGFQPHEILELLLFFGIPQRDTNEIAHTLIDSFGSLSEAMDSPYEELVGVKGMTRNAATLMKLIPKVCGSYLMDKHTGQEVFTSAEMLGRFFVDRFLGTTEETVYLLCLDSSLNKIACEKMADGTITRANVPVKKVVSCLLRHNASRVVLAHNHPRGEARPSSEDLLATRNMVSALRLLDVELVDHVVVAGKFFYSIRAHHEDFFVL